jgi:hypothetical protein
LIYPSKSAKIRFVYFHQRFSKIMKKYALLFCLTAITANVWAQTDKSKDDKSGKQPANVAATIAKTGIKPDATPLELARAAVTAHGGDKFKTMKSLTEIGTADVAMPGSAQTMTVTYKLIMAGDKFRFEINSPFANFQQIYDGENLYASMGGSDVPPLSKVGINLIVKAEDKGYTISALPDKKKRRGFRIVTPEGYTTDFYLDPATAQVMSYEAKFTVRDRTVSTAVEHDKFREVEGVLVP